MKVVSSLQLTIKNGRKTANNALKYIYFSCTECCTCF